MKFWFSVTLIFFSLILTYKIIFKEDVLPNLPSKNHQTYIEPALVFIKAGSFTMGGIIGSQKDEKPSHKVKIKKSFYMGRYEVTFEEFDKFCEDTGLKKPDDNGWGRGKRPVINISWEEAKAYTLWLSKKTKHQYKLPSETQWEYAARAGTETIYSSGNSFSTLNKYAWYDPHSNNSTQEVGLKKPNNWGLYDIHGNVYEFCEDWYINSYENTPRNEKAYNIKTSSKVIRGGSWAEEPYSLRTSNRFKVKITMKHSMNGFRLVRLINM